jgi:squalene-hopene/tetraprenyl-beta-curcumene cyclase
LTAHALRALYGWRNLMAGQMVIARGIDRSIQRGLTYLYRHQRPDGSWVPLWFGNQDHPDEENPIYGTARVLLAYRDVGQLDSFTARRGLDYLARVQNQDGGWGGDAGSIRQSSVEETALACEALGAADSQDLSLQNKVHQGLKWLIRAVDENRHKRPSPIGFYFARLWYYEQLYPLTFAVSALGQAARRHCPRPEPTPTHVP